MLARSNKDRLRVRRRRVTRGRAAFTIIELVIVLVIIGIIGSVVGPAFWRASTVDAAGSLTTPVVSLLRFAQRTATQRNEVVTTIIDPSTNAYQVQTAVDGITRAAGTLAFPTQARFLTDSLRLRVVFNPTGSATADSIIVAGPQMVALVRVDPWTGLIDVVRQ
jgi:prepilin-type N-terminal cleavage/methylation domain-containing protein